MSKILHTLYILLLLAGGIFCVPAKSWATEQAGDILVIHQDTLDLLACPLELDRALSDKVRQRMGNHIFATTAHARGYIAVWRLKDELLFLEEIQGEAGYRMPLDSIFDNYRNAKGEICASWVTSDLRASADKEAIYHSSAYIGFSRYYANETIFRIERGRLVETDSYQNAFRKGDYSIMESYIKIVQGFDGSKFPELEGKRLIAVKMTVYPTADGRIDSLSVSYTIRDDREFLEVSPQQARRYTEELRRHADSLRWDALILRGVIQPLPPYNFPLYPTSQKIKSFRLPSPGSR